MEYRTIKQDDLETLVHLANRFASFDSDVDDAFFYPTESFPQGCLIAEDDGHIVGFIFSYLREIPSTVLTRWNANKVAQIELLAVAASHRNQGIGAALLERLLSNLKNEGVDYILLHCPIEAKEAKHLYDKAGFEVRAYAMRKRI